MAAFGFRPVRYTNGAPWNGATVRCSITASETNAMGIGDSVILAGTSYSSAVDGAILNDVVHCAAGNRVYGVITAFLPAGQATLDLSKVYGVASTIRECLVAVAEPNLVFETTANGALVVSGASAVQGTMYDIATYAAASTSTGLSANTLDTGASSTSSATWYLLGVRNDPANLATLVTSGTTTVASVTVLEVVCAEPQCTITQLGAGV